MAGLDLSALAGHYELRPGQAHSVHGQRPVLGASVLGRVLRGQRGAQVGRTLSSVFTLCAHAHQRAASLALGLATPGRVTLLLETARDHLRAMALDWPQRLSQPQSGTLDTDWWQDGPLSLVASTAYEDERAAAALTQLREWLEQRILLEPVRDWLQRHGDPQALAQWCDAQAQCLPPARYLAAAYPVAQSLKPDTRLLQVLHDDSAQQTSQLQALARTIAQEPGFVQQPQWQGACAENGPWARLRHRRGHGVKSHNAWTRLSARWMELMEIAATSATPLTHSTHDEQPLLASGTLRLSQDSALGWCEMARGLLLHWVQHDASGAVLDYRVLAPTEWNFHPQGALAQAVAALAPNDAIAAQTLAAAYDPCVVCSVHTTAKAEAHHA